MSTHYDDYRDNETPDRSIAELARRQHGVFGRGQALEVGLTVHQVNRRLRIGRWESVLPQVFRVAGAPSTPKQIAMAATLWAGPGSLVSHGAAALLWGIEGVRAPKVELWVPAPRNPRDERVVVHRGTRLDRADRGSVDGIPVTTPTRTLIDVSGRLEDDALLTLLESMLRHGVTTRAKLSARLTALRVSGRAGAGRLCALLDADDLHSGHLESRLESRCWRIILDSELPTPARQHWIVAGGRRYRVDFAWPSQRVVVECDGWEHHGGRARFESDEQRRADLASHGWLVIPVTWKQCAASAADVVARIALALRRVA